MRRTDIGAIVRQKGWGSVSVRWVDVCKPIDVWQALVEVMMIVGCL